MLEIFHLWLSTGRLFDHPLHRDDGTRKTARRQLLLCKAWAFANHVGSPGLQNATLDELIRTVRIGRRLPIDESILEVCYGDRSYLLRSKLRNLLADLLITAGKDLISQIDPSKTGYDLQHDHFRRSTNPQEVERLQRYRMRLKPFHEVVNLCDYHNHDNMQEEVSKHGKS